MSDDNNDYKELQAMSLLEQGKYEMRKRKFANAIKTFSELVSLVPDDWGYAFLLSKAYFKSDDIDKANVWAIKAGALKDKNDHTNARHSITVNTSMFGAIA